MYYILLLSIHQSLELKFLKFRCLTEMGKSEKNIHLTEQHTQLGLVKLSESEVSTLLSFCYIN